MKHIFLGLLVLFCLSFVDDNKKSDWEVLYNENKITISSQPQGCSDAKTGNYKEYVFLKFINESNDPVEITYYTEIYYSDNCYSCDNKKAYTHSFMLYPNREVKGSCSNKRNSLTIFSSMLDGTEFAELTKFEIKDIKIEKR